MSNNELMENETEQENLSFEVEDEQSQAPASQEVVASADESEEKTSTIVQEEGTSELENYSENVQKRINQLTAKRKQAVEEAEAAYGYAQSLQQQNEEMKQRIAQLDQGYIAEYDGRVESQAAAAKRMLQEAYDNGDMEKMAQAQEVISGLAIEKERLRISKNRQQRQAQAPVQQQAPQQVAQPRQQQELDPKLKSWIGKNPWFGEENDLIMTRGAQAIHEQIVAIEGFDPNTDEYYQEIDRRMRHHFPHKFQEQRQNAQAVAPASNGRSSNKTGRTKTVQLLPGHVEVARKMNIPLELMAKEVAKLERKVK
jgi:hypothetical protein